MIVAAVVCGPGSILTSSKIGAQTGLSCRLGFGSGLFFDGGYGFLGNSRGRHIQENALRRNR